ncbi:MAG TPA: CusA/CzcA family heavy metal efflux RND transporter [Methylophilus sp.]|uniref:efflux RND transporter permease subunit n=1 Tax=Methylophilus sp. TaxID=29541 RepID=UPI002BDD498F|nr:CusA/CzcA family heavy metal efflux RND transporter [Methylophilus sp.]HSH86414.1 CusA/CzcA family heavy metal efflux RND transporter [Methylophilus sp.]
MLYWMLETSLRYRLLVILAAVLLIFFGVKAWQNVPLDAFPDVTPAQVNIYTESPGLASEDVEKLVTFPVESALAGLKNIEHIRSVSLFGLSYVSVYFKDDTDIQQARFLVSEKLSDVKARITMGDGGTGYGEPTLGPNTSGLGQVLWYTLKSDTMSGMELRSLQDWTVRMMVRTAAGVDDVTTWGGQEKQFQVQIDPQKLFKYGLTFAQVVERLTANNRQVGGQFINVGQEQFLVRGLGLVKNTADIQKIVVAENQGIPVYVENIATVVEGPGLRFGAVTQDGKEVVMGMVLARMGENAQQVVNAAKQKLALVKSALPKNVTLETVYDRTAIIDKAIHMADRAMLEGALLVIAVLFLLLGEIRAALVVVVAIPLGRLIAFILMAQYGVSANLMSLGGLIIGLGMTIDGPLVMVENCFRRLAHAGNQVNKTQVILQACKEVIHPIAFGMLIITVVFLPIFSLSGLEGKLFKPLAINMIFAMTGSMLLTLTLIPVLSSLMLKRSKAPLEKEPWLIHYCKPRYHRWLQWSLGHQKIIVAVTAIAFVAAMLMFQFLGKSFMPNLQEQDILFRVTSIPSASLEQSISVSDRVYQSLKNMPEVKGSVAMIGRAEKGEIADVNYMEILVHLQPLSAWPQKISYQQLAQKLQSQLEKEIPEAVIAATQPIQMRVEELISGVRATLSAKVYGEDLATLDRIANQVKSTIEKVDGVTDLALEANVGKPQLIIDVNREAIARYGINVDEVLQVVQSGIGGKRVSTVLEGVKRFAIQVWLPPAYRDNLKAIGDIPITTAQGALVPLSQVATLKTEEGYAFIRREQLQRYAVIQMDVQGRDIDGFVKEAQASIDRHITLPSGYWIEWGGAFENQQRALTKLAIIVPLTIGLIFVLLYTAFDSLRYAGLILANVPFAAMGGIFSLAISGQYLSVPAAIGFIAVFGVAMLNGIVLVSFINSLRAEGKSIREAVLEGTSLRLRPVMMTALVEIVGLIPFVLATGVGSEILRPLAIVVIGGLLTATLLTLICLPVVYDWMETRNAPGAGY